jgi:hypothetical protein
MPLRNRADDASRLKCAGFGSRLRTRLVKRERPLQPIADLHDGGQAQQDELDIWKWP